MARFVRTNNNPGPIILVCGSAPRGERPGFRNRRLVESVVGDFDRDAIVVEGGAAGPDTWARLAAQARGLHVATVKALWQHFGKSAGHRRNGAMLRLGVTRVVAFWDGSSPGTKGTMDAAHALGIVVIVYREDGSSEVRYPA